MPRFQFAKYWSAFFHVVQHSQPLEWLDMESSISNLQTPTSSAERIASIDTLRGFALLGILVMNINSFGMIGSAYMNPTALGPPEGLDYVVWWIAHLLAEMKFMTIFSALFGAGIVLMWQRAKRGGRKSTWLHYRRMFWLLVIGLAHAHLLWFGDILVPYALCGMVMYWLSGLRPRWLIPSGIMLIGVGSALMLVSGLTMPNWPEETVAKMSADWAPTAEQIEMQLAMYRGSWLEQMPYRSIQALSMETFLFLFLFFWRIGGLMLIGMALFKLGFFSGERSHRFYGIGAIVGLIVGGTLIQFGVLQNHHNQWTMQYSFFLGSQYNYWGSLLVAFAWSCLVILACKLQWMNWLLNALAAVGRMALSNYLLHTIICTTFFYGHGFGWYGYLSRSSLLLIVLFIWVLQLIVSPWWLKRFRFGPFEWLWRSLTYWSWQPMRREPTVAN